MFRATPLRPHRKQNSRCNRCGVFPQKWLYWYKRRYETRFRVTNALLGLDEVVPAWWRLPAPTGAAEKTKVWNENLFQTRSGRWWSQIANPRLSVSVFGQCRYSPRRRIRGFKPQLWECCGVYFTHLQQWGRNCTFTLFPWFYHQNLLCCKMYPNTIWKSFFSSTFQIEKPFIFPTKHHLWYNLIITTINLWKTFKIMQ